MADEHPKTIYDISQIIKTDLPVYPGDPSVDIETVTTIADDGYRVSRLHMGSHTGTHIDAPNHFLPGGKAIDEIPLHRFMSTCTVVEIDHPRAVVLEDIEGLAIEAGHSILFKTQNSERLVQDDIFDPEYIYIEEEAAAFLAARGVNLVGIDSLSVETYDSAGFRTHKIFLDSDVIILEGVVLTDVPPGTYQLICLPLRLQGLDASPVRAVLLGD